MFQLMDKKKIANFMLTPFLYLNLLEEPNTIFPQSLAGNDNQNSKLFVNVLG